MSRAGEAPGHGAPAAADADALSLADRWIRSRLAAMLARIEAGFADYRLDIVANALYEFTWNEFCDWYVELSKAVLQSDTASEAQKRGTRATLISTLEVLLRALHPLAPFITEEIWQRVRAAAGVAGETIMRCEFPDRAGRSDGRRGGTRDALGHEFHLGRAADPRRNGYRAEPASSTCCCRTRAATDVEYLARNRAYLTRSRGVADPRRSSPGEAGADLRRGAARAGSRSWCPWRDSSIPRPSSSGWTKRRRRAETELGQIAGEARATAIRQERATRRRCQGPQRLAELRTEIDQLTQQVARVNALLRDRDEARRA